MLRVRMAFGRWFAERFVSWFFPMVNPLVLLILRSPFHWLLSWYVAVLRFQGVRTGNSYDVPFAFHRVDARTIECLTSRKRLWWHNLRVRADASLLHRGRWLAVRAEAIEDEATVADALPRRDLPRRLLMPLLPSDSVVVRVTFGD